MDAVRTSLESKPTDEEGGGHEARQSSSLSKALLICAPRALPLELAHFCRGVDSSVGYQWPVRLVKEVVPATVLPFSSTLPSVDGLGCWLPRLCDDRLASRRLRLT